MPETAQNIRLHKFLSQAGVASRRKAEDLIQQGRVAVNGQPVTTLGTTITPAADKVTVNGRPVHPTSRRITYILNKPAGLICSASDRQGQTVFSLFAGKVRERLFTVGRLDKYSEGLLLLTNDGNLAQSLTHPQHGHTKTYDVTVNGNVTPQQLEKLRRPMLMDGYRTQGARVMPLPQARIPNTTTLRIILQEGRSRQIRNMCAQLELPIRQLRRIRIGALELNNLKVGTFRPLSPKEFALLDLPDTETRPRAQQTATSATHPATAAKAPIPSRANDRGDQKTAPQSRARHPHARAKAATQPGANGQARSKHRAKSTG